jgi:nitrate reductase gamma subunit
MEQAYQFASGPLFRFCFALMVLGLARKVVLFGYGRAVALKVTRHESVAWGPVFKESIRWLFPLGRASSKGVAFAVVSMVFHAGLLAAVFFLEGHLLLLRRSAGVRWPSLPGGAADILSVVVVIAALFMLSARLIRPPFRSISGVQDYGFLSLIIVIFITGLAASRPFNPFSYSGTMFVHATAGDILMAFLPFSKMAHGMVFPTARIFSQIGWKLSPGSPGRRMGGAEGRPNNKD